MALQIARNIAKDIKQHPLFDPNDETMFIAGYIFEIMNYKIKITEDIWDMVLSMLFNPINLFYDLPENCQEIINRMLYTQNVVDCIKNSINLYNFNHGPMIERYINVKFMRANSIRRLRYTFDIFPYTEENINKHLYQNIKNKFYNRRTCQILKHRLEHKYNETQYNMEYGQPSELLEL